MCLARADHVRVGRLDRAQGPVDDPGLVGGDVLVELGQPAHGVAELPGGAAGDLVGGDAHVVGYGLEGQVGAYRVHGPQYGFPQGFGCLSSNRCEPYSFIRPQTPNHHHPEPTNPTHRNL